MTHAFGNGGGSASKRGPDRGATRRTRRDGRVDMAHWPKYGNVTPAQKGGPANSYLAGSHFAGRTIPAGQGGPQTQPAASGSSNHATVPPPSRGSRPIRPPCASKMRRQVARPMP